VAILVGLSVGTQPPIRRIHLTLRLARALGFDSVWTVDHFLSFFPRAIWDREFSWIASPDSSPDAFFDYQVLLGHLAARAGKLQLAVGVTEPIRRHPVLLAQAFLTLSHLTRRPPILGIGAGERENTEPYGFSFEHPVAQLEEALQIIRLAFESQGPFNFKGNYFTLDRALMDLRPAPGRTPEVWIAAHGPRMLRLTGQYGDGWYPTIPMTPQDYGERLAVIRAAAVDAGRDQDAITPGYLLFAVIGRTEAEARAALSSRPVRFTALLAPDEAWQRAGVTHPLGAGFRGMIDFVPPRYARAELEAAMAKVPVDLLMEQGVWGTKQQVLNKIREYEDAGLRHLVLAPVAGLISRRHAITSLRAVAWIARRLRS